MKFVILSSYNKYLGENYMSVYAVANKLKILNYSSSALLLSSSKFHYVFCICSKSFNCPMTICCSDNSRISFSYYCNSNCFIFNYSSTWRIVFVNSLISSLLICNLLVFSAWSDFAVANLYIRGCICSYASQ